MQALSLRAKSPFMEEGQGLDTTTSMLKAKYERAGVRVRERWQRQEEGRESWASTQNSGRTVRLTFTTQEAIECSRRRLQLAQKAQGRAQINFTLSTF